MNIFCIVSERRNVLTNVPDMSTLIPIMGTIDGFNSLSRALFGETRRSVLSIFFRNPGRSLYMRQVIRLVGAGQGAVQRELNVLADAGILSVTRIGRQVFFQANPHCPIYSDLRKLILKTSGLADVIRMAFRPLSDRIKVAFVYGSFTDGRDTSASDVDVMVIGGVLFSEVADSLHEAQLILEREINPTVYPVSEFTSKTAAMNGFLTRVLAGEKIYIIGDDNELAGLGGERLADRTGD